MKKPIYITTSIAYVNAEPHIGFLYELLAADVLKRYHQSIGHEVFLVTGTDEHGTKVAQAAAAAGQEPQAYVDQVAENFKALKDFGTEYDYFIRTTNLEHQQFVQEKWTKLVEAGVLQKKPYKGFYCSGCEAFKNESEIKDGKCVIHERDLEQIEEENWFLILSDNLKSGIKKFIEECVEPATRRQEVLNVLESGAYDEISVSRSREKLSWGVPVPNDNTQTMYVWVDALFNYLSALKINSKENYWPADIQIIGKDILKFHAIIWPALLLATGEELPKKLLVHGFINVDGKKMSKSLGNVVTPAALKERYGVEATRYLLFRQLSFYDDSNFSWDEFDALYNGELANGLGNLVARVIGLAKVIPTDDLASIHQWIEVHRRKQQAFFREILKRDRVDFQREVGGFVEGAEESLINRGDSFITRKLLWRETEKKSVEVRAVFNLVLELSFRLEPFMPETAKEIRRQLETLESKPLFPRLQK